MYYMLYVLYIVYVTGIGSDNPKKDPTFLRHFDNHEGEDKPQARRGPPTGPTSISNYFPNIPSTMTFRDYVSKGTDCVNNKNCLKFIRGAWMYTYRIYCYVPCTYCMFYV